MHFGTSCQKVAAQTVFCWGVLGPKWPCRPSIHTAWWRCSGQREAYTYSSYPLGSPHHPLQCFAIKAAPVPGWNASIQHALGRNHRIRRPTESLGPWQTSWDGKHGARSSLEHSWCLCHMDDVNSKKLVAGDPLHGSLTDGDRFMPPTCLPVVHNHLLVLSTDFVPLTPLSQSTNLSSVHCLIIVGNYGN